MSGKLRIGLDARLAARGLGIAQLIGNLAEQLAPLTDVVWFGDPRKAPGGVAGVRTLDRLPYPALDSGYGRALAGREELDVFHFTANAGWTRPGPVPFVLTVHDLIFLHTRIREQGIRQAVGHRYLRWNVPRAARQAAAVVTVSQTSAAEVDRHLTGVRVAEVIPNASDLPPIDAPDGNRFDCAVAFSAPDPRKGLELAYRGWVQAGRIPDRFEVLGGVGVSKGFQLLAAEDLRSGRARILPYLERDQLHERLRRAGVLVFPSKEEGFGLPVLEAMAAGTPVIAGLAPATIEVGGDAIARIDPADPVRSIAESLRRLQVDAEWRAHLQRAGLRRAQAYSWAKSAERYLAVYESVRAT